MDTVADDRINETREFTNQFVVFPTHSGSESLREELAARLSCGAQFFIPPVEPPEVTPEKGLAAGVLKQAAHDLRRFHAATTGVKRELYLDAYSWINADDFSWPYSFMNVCKLLDLCPEVVRAELLADAALGPLHYWISRAARLSRKLGFSVVRVFETCRNSEAVAGNELAPSI